MRQRDSRTSSSTLANGHRATAARDRLDQAVAELRRLTQGQLFQALERLADVEDIRGASSVSVESIRRLRAWSAEHLRLAAELEAAARCCRLIEQELTRKIDATLAGSHVEADALGDHSTGASLMRSRPRSHRKKNRVMGVSGWLRSFAPHRHSAHRRPGKEPARAFAATSSHPPVTRSGQSLLVAGMPEADVTALILGPLELSVAGRHVVRWNSLKARAVFQYLLIHRGRPVRRDVLMDLQWPNHTYTSARNNLNVALYSLRNTLEGPWQGLRPILYQDGCYALNSELKWWIDRDEFLTAFSRARLVRSGHPVETISHYQKAVELYRGSLFEDDSNGDWYLAEQRHLNELYLQALESLGEIYLDLGELASAQKFAQLALAKDPCCESVHRLLMRCYAAEHKQQLVSRQYSICVQALRDELGVSPGTETLRLFHALTSASP
jgi:DNA-binding SARP family transcriptional activator